MEEFVDEGFLRGLTGKDLFLEFLEFRAELLDDGRIVVDEQIEQGVRDAIGAARAGGGALRKVLGVAAGGRAPRAVGGLADVGLARGGAPVPGALPAQFGRGPGEAADGGLLTAA